MDGKLVGGVRYSRYAGKRNSPCSSLLSGLTCCVGGTASSGTTRKSGISTISAVAYFAATSFWKRDIGAASLLGDILLGDSAAVVSSEYRLRHASVDSATVMSTSAADEGKLRARLVTARHEYRRACARNDWEMGGLDHIPAFLRALETLSKSNAACLANFVRAASTVESHTSGVGESSSAYSATLPACWA